jgi:hypothetical protein
MGRLANGKMGCIGCCCCGFVKTRNLAAALPGPGLHQPFLRCCEKKTLSSPSWLRLVQPQGTQGKHREHKILNLHPPIIIRETILPCVHLGPLWLKNLSRIIRVLRLAFQLGVETRIPVSDLLLFKIGQLAHLLIG